MRPEKAYQIINNVLSQFYTQYDFFPEKHGLLSVKFKNAVDCLTVKFQREDIRDFEDVKEFIEKSAIFTPAVSYYTIQKDEDVLGNLFYVSDRWRCTGRLLYLQDVIRYLEMK